MKYNLNINQYAVFNNPEFSCLTLQDLVVFDFVKDFANSSACKRNSDGYFWIKHTIVSDALPILGVFNEESKSRKDICRAKIAQIMRKLCKVGLLSASPDNEAKGISEYGFGANYDKMIFAKDAQKNSDPSKNLLPPYQNFTTPPSKNLLPYNSNNTNININEDEVTPNIDKSILEVTAKGDKSPLPPTYSEDFILDSSLPIDSSPTAWQSIIFDNPHDVKELCAKWLGDESLLNYKGILAVDFDAKRNTPKGRMSDQAYFGKIYNMWASSKDETKLKNDKGECKNVGIVFSSISPDISGYQCFNFYADFFERETGLPPKVANSDMGLIENIVGYLKKINKKPTFDAVASFKGFLNNLPTYYKTASNLKLIKLSQNIEAIIQKIREATKAPKVAPILTPDEAKAQARATLTELGLNAKMIDWIAGQYCADMQSAIGATLAVLIRDKKIMPTEELLNKFKQAAKVLKPSLK